VYPLSFQTSNNSFVYMYVFIPLVLLFLNNKN
jgi:hypothetical protein